MLLTHFWHLMTDFIIIIQYSDCSLCWREKKKLTCSGGCVLSWGTYSWRSSGSCRRRCRWRCWSGRSWRARSGCRPPPRTGSAAARPRTCSQCGSWVQARLKLRKNIKAKFKKKYFVETKNIWEYKDTGDQHGSCLMTPLVWNPSVYLHSAVGWWPLGRLRPGSVVEGIQGVCVGYWIVGTGCLMFILCGWYTVRVSWSHHGVCLVMDLNVNLVWQHRYPPPQHSPSHIQHYSFYSVILIPTI